MIPLKKTPVVEPAQDEPVEDACACGKKTRLRSYGVALCGNRCLRALERRLGLESGQRRSIGKMAPGTGLLYQVKVSVDAPEPVRG